MLKNKTNILSKILSFIAIFSLVFANFFPTTMLDAMTISNEEITTLNDNEEIVEEEIPTDYIEEGIEDEINENLGAQNRSVYSTSLATEVNTVAYFHPSTANSRYYIYMKKGDKLHISWDLLTQGRVIPASKPTVDQYVKFYPTAGSSLAMMDLTIPITRDQIVNEESIDVIGTNGAPIVADVEGIYYVDITHQSDLTLNDQTTGRNMRINVSDSNNKVLTGRFWTYRVYYYQFATVENVMDETHWFVTIDGYVYSAKYNEYHGVWSNMVSDGIGNTSVEAKTPEECLSTYGSSRSAETIRPAANINICGKSMEKNKIFFDKPAADLPTESKLPDGTTEWVKPNLKAIDIITPTFTSTSTVSHAGDFGVQIDNFQGEYLLEIDTNGNGVFNDPADLSVPRIYRYDTPQTFSWDGKDNFGNEVPNSGTVIARVKVEKAGEIHFIVTDAEGRGKGIEVERLNGHEPVTDLNKNILYWDDTHIRSLMQEDVVCPMPDKIDASAGATSGLQHQWPFNASNVGKCEYRTDIDVYAATTSNYSWGDGNYIEDWTYETLKEATKQVVIGPKKSTPSNSKEADNKIVQAADTLTYTIKAENTGTARATETFIQDQMLDKNTGTSILDSVVETATSPITVTGIVAGSLKDKNKVVITNPTIQHLIDGIYVDIEPNHTASTTPGVYTAEVKIPLTVKTPLNTNNLSDSNSNGLPDIKNEATIIMGGNQQTVTETVDLGEIVIEGNKKAVDANQDGLIQDNETITYTLTAKNSGDITATNVSIKDTLAEVLPYIENGTTPENINVTITGGLNYKDASASPISSINLKHIIDGITVDIRSKETVSVVFTVQSKAGLDITTITDYDNDGKIELGNQAVINDIPTDKIELEYDIPALAITKSITDESAPLNTATAGEKLNYAITVKNTGGALSKDTVIKETATDSMLWNHLAAGYENAQLTITSNITTSKNHNLTNNGVAYTVADLKAGIQTDVLMGETITIEFSVNVKSDFKPTDEGIAKLTNTVKVTNKHGNSEEKSAEILTGQENITYKKSAVTGSKNDNILEQKNGANNETITYSIDVTNTGDITAYNVHVKDTLTSVQKIMHNKNLSGAAVTITNSEDGPTSATLQDLATTGIYVNVPSNKTVTLTFTVEVDPGFNVFDTNTGIFEENGVYLLRNTAYVNDAPIDADVVVNVPELSLAKTMKDSLPAASPDGKLQPGESFEYAIEVTNNGTTTSYQTVIKDTLEHIENYIQPITNSDQVTIASSIGGTTSAKVKDLQLGNISRDILPNETLTLRFTLKVKDDLDKSLVSTTDASGNAIFKNIATAKNSNQPEKTVEKDVLLSSPKLAISKDVSDSTGDQKVQPNEGFTYTLTVENSGDSTSYATEVKDTLATLSQHINDPASQVVKVTRSSTGIVDTTSYKVSNLMSGINFDILSNETIILEFTLVAKGSYDGTTIINDAHAKNSIEEVQDDISIDGGTVGFAMTKDAYEVGTTTDKALIANGDSFDYVISATNNGSVVDTMHIQDTLTNVMPAIVNGNNLSAISMSQSIGGVTTTRNVQELVDGFDVILQANETVTLRFTVQSTPGLDVSNKTSLENTATVASKNVGTTLSKKEVLTYLKPNLTIEKSVVDSLPSLQPDGFAQANEQLTYQIKVKNTGKAVSTNTVIKDDLLGIKTNFVSGYETSNLTITSTNVAHNDNSKTVTDLMNGISYATLEPDEEITITFNATLRSDIATSTTSLINTAKTWSKDEPTPKEKSATILVKHPNVSVGKVAKTAINDDKSVGENENITYTLHATNTGAVTAYDVLVKDEMLAVKDHLSEVNGNNLATAIVRIEENGVLVDTKTVAELQAGILIDVPVNTTVNIIFEAKLKPGFSLHDLQTTNQGKLTNTANINGTTVEDTVTVEQPVLVVEKSVKDTLPLGTTDGKIQPGELFTYAITIENTGTVTSKNTKIEDTLSSIEYYIAEHNATFLVIDGSTTSYTIQDLKLGNVYLDVAPATTRKIEFTVKAIENANFKTIPNQSLKNEVVITNDSGQSGKGSTTTPTISPSLTIKKTVKDNTQDGKIQNDEKFTYTITVANTGNATSYQTKIEDTMLDASGVNVLDYIDQNKLSNKLIIDNTLSTYTIQDLIDGNVYLDIEKQTSVEIKVEVTAVSNIETSITEGTVIKNTAVASTTYERTESSTTIETGKVDGIADKTGKDSVGNDGKVAPSEEVEYLITAQNTGNVTTTVSIQDDLTNVLPYIKEATTLGQLSMEVKNDGVVDTDYTTVQQLLSGISLTVESGKTVEVRFKVTIKDDLDTSDTNVTFLENDATVTIGGKEITVTDKKEFEKPKIEASKSVKDTQIIPGTSTTDGKAQPGENLNYEITVKNTGKATAYNVHIQDTLATDNLKDYLKTGYEDAVLTVKNNTTGNSDTYTVKDLQADAHETNAIIIDIKAGHTYTVSFTVAVKETGSLPTTLKNVAEITPPNDTPITPESEITTVAPNIISEKLVETSLDGDAILTENESLTYTINVANTGDAPAYNVSIIDPLTDVKAIMQGSLSGLSGVKFEVTGLGTNQDKLYSLKDLMDGNFTLDIPAGKTAKIQFEITPKANLNVNDAYGNTTNAIPGFQVNAQDEIVLTNTATIAGVDKSATVIIAKPELVMEKTVVDSNDDYDITGLPVDYVQANESLTYTLTVKNTGDATSYQTVIKDELATIKDQLTGNYENTTVTMKTSLNPTQSQTTKVAQLMNGSIKRDIKPNETWTLTFTVQVKPEFIASQYGGTFTNIAIADNGYQSADDTVTLETKDPVLTIKKEVNDADGIIVANEEFDYTITVENTSEVTSYNSLIQDASLTQLFEYLLDPSATNLTVTNNAGTDATTYTVKDLIDGATASKPLKFDIAPNEKVKIQFSVTAIADLAKYTDGTILENTATVIAQNINESDSATTVIGKAGLETQKSAYEDGTDTEQLSISDSEVIDYVIRAKNIGEATDTITVQDDLANIVTNAAIVDYNNLSNISLQVSILGIDGITESPILTYTNLAQLVTGITENIEPEETLLIRFKVQSMPGYDVANKTLINTAKISSVNENKTYTPKEEVVYEQPELETQKTVTGEWVDIESDGSVANYAQPKEKLTYTIQVKNIGEAASIDTTIQDTLSDIKNHTDIIDTDYVTIESILADGNPGAINTSTSLYTIADLKLGNIKLNVQPGETLNVSFSVKVKATFDATTVTSLNNQANITNKTGEHHEPAATIPTVTPVLELAKDAKDLTEGDKIVQAGESVKYTLTIDNLNGTADTQNIIIQDDLAYIMSYIDNPDANGVKIFVDGIEDTTNAYTVADLRAGISYNTAKRTVVTIEFSVTVKADLDTDTVIGKDNKIGFLTNEAVIDGEKVPNEIITGKAIIEADKSVTDSYPTIPDHIITPGECFTYTITVRNVGTVIERNVMVQDTLNQLLSNNYIENPSGNVLKITTNGQTDDTNTVADLIAGFSLDVAAGQEYTITFEVQAKSDLDVTAVPDTDGNGRGEFVNIATVGSVDPDDTTSTIDVGAPIIESSKTLIDQTNDEKVENNELFVYKINAKNTGNAPSYNTFIQDTLVDVLPYIAADFTPESVVVTINGGSNHSEGATTTLDKLIAGFTVDIAEQEEIEISFTLKAMDELYDTDITDHDNDGIKDFYNKATVDKTNPENTTPIGFTLISVDKVVSDSDADGIVTPNEVFTYTIEVENSGNITHHAVEIRDTLEKVLPYTTEENTPDSVLVNIQDAAGVLIETKTLSELIAGFEISIPAYTKRTLTFTLTAKTEKELAQELKDIETEDQDGVKQLVNIVTAEKDRDDEIIPIKTPEIITNKTVEVAEADGIIKPQTEFTYHLTAENVGNYQTASGIYFKDELATILPFVEEEQATDTTMVRVKTINPLDMTETSFEITLAELLTGFTTPNSLAIGDVIDVSITLTMKDQKALNNLEFGDRNVEGNYILNNVATIDDTEKSVEVPFIAPKVIGNKKAIDSNGNGYLERAEYVTYTITAENIGNATAEQVFIQDEMQKVLPYITNGISTENIPVVIQGGENISPTVTTLADLINGFTVDIPKDSTFEITFTVQILEDLDPKIIEEENAVGHKVLLNQAIVDSSTPEVEIPVLLPYIEATKEVIDASGNGMAHPGEELSYVITAKNTGNTKGEKIVIQDELADLIEYVDTSMGIENIEVQIVGGSNITPEVKSLKDLMKGFVIDINIDETVIITFKVNMRENIELEDIHTINAEEKPIFTNTARVDTGTVTTTIPAHKSIIISEKSVQDENGDGIVTPGELITYTITAKNIGTADKVGVFIQDKLENILPYIEEQDTLADVAVIINGGSNIQPHNQVMMSMLKEGIYVDIAAGGEVTISFTITVKKDLDTAALALENEKGHTILFNMAIVDEGNPTAEIPVTDEAIFGNKIATDENGDGKLEIGEKITYKLSAQNLTDFKVEAVNIKDDLTKVLPYIEEKNKLDSVPLIINGGTIVGTSPKVLADLINGIQVDLAPRETATIEFTVTLAEIPKTTDKNGVITLFNNAIIGDSTITEEIPIKIGTTLVSTGEKVLELIIYALALLGISSTILLGIYKYRKIYKGTE